jgi:hypothetical protein
MSRSDGASREPSPNRQTLRWVAADRGLLGGSMPWLILAGAVWGVRALRRAAGPGPMPGFSTLLDEGEGIAVVTRKAR